MLKLNDEILEQYLNQFWGYGALDAKYWFIGMEEGGELDVPHFNDVLQRWAVAGAPPVVDICKPDSAETSPFFKSDRPKIQPTWGKLIRLVLAAEGESVNTEAVRRYQQQRLARSGSAECLLELMPLPAPKVSDWPYTDHTEISELKDRAAYMSAFLGARKHALKQLILKHRPKAVIFYSQTYFEHWQGIVGRDVVWSDQGSTRSAAVDGVQVYCVPHPTAFGTTNATYEELGRVIGAC